MIFCERVQLQEKSVSPILTVLVFALYAVAAAAGLISMFRSRRLTVSVMVGALFVGFALHTAGFLFLVARTRSIPVRSFYDIINFSLWIVALVAISVDRLYRMPALSVCLLPLLVVFSCAAMLFAHRPAATSSDMDALWLALHTIPILAGFACFSVGFAASLLYLGQEHRLKLKALGPLLGRLPSLEVLDRLARRATLAGFPIYTVGLLLGFAWAKVGNRPIVMMPPDPTVLASVLTWVLYAMLTHVRLAQITHGRRVALLTVFSFALILLLFLAASLLGRFHPASAAAILLQ